MTEISQRQLRNDSGEMLRRVEAGEVLVVTRRGVPVADLVPHREPVVKGPRRWVPAADFHFAVADLPPWSVAEFETEQKQLDDAVSDELRDVWEPRS
ncbi:hypothetical protein JNB_14618 [Janibacter sp. HTCC2649]|uniref:type II toxin-antitoxin system Phd/YefM family antitoxin n=1 Tax=Janibacter sp. HTCC2649 TaxID=313589 RepID=UPI0000671AAD|nr:type II toxin-antitoxin system prevent-host-death family antitoxin [Janibacter sp. HTCC2649]EAP98206.1 hypothetical protein JNB_14618 [Janibacter sp. HTCC2649]